MIKRDIFIVDHITRLSYREVNPRLMEDITITIKNTCKYRGKIERRKQKKVALRTLEEKNVALRTQRKKKKTWTTL
jgi:hypothetical protein